MTGQNDPVPQILGLTPGEFERLALHFFDSPGDIRIAERVETHPSGAMVTVLDTLAGLMPLQCEAEGLLPESVLSTVMERLRQLPEYAQIMADDDALAGLGLKLILMALVGLERADVLRWDGHAYVPGPTYSPDVKAGDYRSIYPHLFRTFVEQVPWGMSRMEEEENSRREEGPPLEMFFGYTLFQLSRWGGEGHLAVEYALQFFDAVPSAGDQLDDDSEGEFSALSAYVSDVVFGLWAVFGLVDLDIDDKLGPSVYVRPILRELVRFPDAWLRRDLDGYSVFEGDDEDCDDEDWDDEDWDDERRDRVGGDGASGPAFVLPPVDFDGLSPDAVHKLIYTPFDAPDVVSFAEELGGSHSAPVLRVLEEVIKAIDAGGKIGPIATGAFSRPFTRHMAPMLWSDHTYDMIRRTQLPGKEMDLSALHVSRLWLEMAGILRVYKRRFIIARKYRSILKAKGACGVYPHLFRVAAEEYNWAYADGYPEQRVIQQFFAFSLRTLARYGDVPRPSEFYSDAFARAFPTALDEEWGARAHTHRTFGHFAWLLGLVTITRADHHWQTPDVYEATPLFREFVRFQV